MNYTKSILLTTICFLVASTMTLYVSCNKKTSTPVEPTDLCVGKTCLNGGTCNKWTGECECPDYYLGESCEYKCPNREEYVGTYVGTGYYVGDTAIISLNSEENKVDLDFAFSNSRHTFICELSKKSCQIKYEILVSVGEPENLNGGIDSNGKKLTLYFNSMYIHTSQHRFEGVKQ